MRSPSRLLLALLVAFALMPLSALALDPINQTRAGLAIQGYDPVAYFTKARPVEGLEEHRLEWMGATWRFASAENRARFAADPDKYAPAYGGYCAYAVAKNSTADIDPQAWTVLDGRLFLNYSPKIQRKWEADRAAHIAAADRNWPALRDRR